MDRVRRLEEERLVAINPVGPVEVSPHSAPDSGDRRFESWTGRKTGTGSSADGEVGDRVFLSDAARQIASIVAREELRPNLSPASSSNAEERHVS
jgi:hypothetical protein